MAFIAFIAGAGSVAFLTVLTAFIAFIAGARAAASLAAFIAFVGAGMVVN